MPVRYWVTALLLLSLTAATASAADPQYSWRYYRPGNTGIQGDYSEAIWIAPDGDPWIGGYDPGFEEGGIARFVQAENRWINISNIDYPVIGHPDVTGTTRVSDIVPDGQGNLWMSTWRGALRMILATGPSSLVNFASASPALLNGGCRDMDIAPDGTLWFALLGFGGSQGGMLRYTPATDTWHYWTGGATPQGGNNWPQLAWSIKHVSVQPKPAGGYIVWGSVDNGSSMVWFDTATQLWTFQDFSYTIGNILDLPGKDNVDDTGHLWARRFAGFSGSTAVYRLDYRRPDGTWVSPAQLTLPAVSPPIWAFKAFGDRQALLVDGNSRVWRFNGSAWSDYGIWREGAFSYDVNIDGLGAVWVCGTEGAAKRDPATGLWQRYRVTNSSQFDSFNNDIAIDPAGGIYACANAGPGFGGMVHYEGTRWIGFNNHQYGLGQPWPFPSDNSNAVCSRPSNGHVVVNPMFDGTHVFNGSTWSALPGGSDKVIGYVEDSTGRLWQLGEYFSLSYWTGSMWNNVGIAAWGAQLRVDPDRPGTVWAHAGYEVVRTDGAYRFSRTIDDFPDLTSQSDTIWGMAVGHNGVVWLGCSVFLGAGGTGGGLIRLDANTGTYMMMKYEDGWPLPGRYVTPWVVTPDGRVWMTYVNTYQYFDGGLCWYDGTNVGTFPGPVDGAPQWGGLPHTQIKDMEVREIPGGYELWMSCLSRGIAVLTVLNTVPVVGDIDGDGQVNEADLTIFVAVLLGNDTNPAHVAASDLSHDGVANGADIQPFVAALIGG
jgi:hypothetical protein